MLPCNIYVIPCIRRFIFNMIGALFILCVGFVNSAPPVREYATLSPIVSTVYGGLQGSRKTHTNDKVYDEFLGIKFGAPPVGTQRWEKPSAPPSWSGVRNATEWGRNCVQIIGALADIVGGAGETGEDCLHLNVWVPNGVDHKAEPLPVMVYATGGAFLVGSGDWYPGQELATTAKVIVVTFNYRLSTLGFLSTSNANLPGNYGLWDSRAALLWVNDNIQAFGGDPKRIVMMGQSAGGAISTHFITSPMTKGLFQRVIALSGAGSAFFGFTKNNAKMARNLGLWMLCPVLPNKAMVDCLRNKESGALDIGGYISAFLLGGQLPGWIPVQDGEFLPQSPQDSWEQGAGSDIDLLIGRTQDDGAGFVLLNPLGVSGGGINLAGTKELLDAVMGVVLKPFGNTTKLIAILEEQYPGIKSEEVLIRTKAASQLLTDFAFASPAYYEAGKHYQNSKKTGKSTYVYNFRYRNSFQGYPSWVNGSHLDDVWALFGEPFFPGIRAELGPSSETDKLVSTNMMKYYGNFAHTGDPNKGPHTLETAWPVYTENEEFLEMSSRNVAKKVSGDMQSRFNFWIKTWPTLVEEDNRSRPEAEDKKRNKAISELLSRLSNYFESYTTN